MTPRLTLLASISTMKVFLGSVKETTGASDEAEQREKAVAQLSIHRKTCPFQVSKCRGVGNSGKVFAEPLGKGSQA